MGIQYLNSYMKHNTKQSSIKKHEFKELYGRVIVIDTSIYLYRFIADGGLLENVYIMIALFRDHNIIPIFVFDGKAPVEKYKLLAKRNAEKKAAENKYYKIKMQLSETKNWNDSTTELYNDMIILKKKFIRLRAEDIIKVQSLMDAFGVTYIEAEGEADVLCAKIVQKKHAYACLSEDMDLFVYGCPRVLRYLSLMNKTVVLYSLDKILKDLDITFQEFKELCILSGTDYNTENRNNLYTTINLLKQFKKSNASVDFYTWIDNTTDCISNIYELYNIYHMFQSNSINLKQYKLNKFIKPVNKSRIEEIMKPEGFIFIK